MASQLAPPAPKPQVKVTAKVKAFLAAIQMNPGIAKSEAARIAGFKHARAVAVSLCKKHAQLVAEAEAEGRKGLKVSADEAEQILADIARDPTHRDRLKAAETFLKMHGKLSDKLQVTVDRATLNKQLDELIATMAAARSAERELPGLQDGDAPLISKN